MLQIFFYLGNPVISIDDCSQKKDCALLIILPLVSLTSFLPLLLFGCFVCTPFYFLFPLFPLSFFFSFLGFVEPSIMVESLPYMFCCCCQRSLNTYHVCDSHCCCCSKHSVFSFLLELGLLLLFPLCFANMLSDLKNLNIHQLCLNPIQVDGYFLFMKAF